MPHCEVRVFGSRYKWTAKDYSDLDLVIIGNKKLDKKVIYDIKEAFSESDLPIRVDVLDWYTISDEFKQIINQGYEVIQKKEKQLPNGWEIKKLGDVVEVNKSSINKTDNFNFINYLDTGNLTEGKIEDVQKLIIGQDKIPSRCKRKVRVGDILYSTVRPNQKHYGYLANILENMIVSTGFCVVSTKISEAYDKFIYYYLTQKYITEQLHAIAEQSKATYQSINLSDLTNLDIELPPLPTQQQIASILSVLDEKIGINNQINKKLEEMAKALFKHWFIDFNFPDENGTPYKDSGDAMIDSELGKIPKGWSFEEIGQVCKCILGGTPSRNNPEYWNGGIAWINSGKTNEYRIIAPSEYITELGLKNSATKLLPAKTNVMAITGTTLGQISLLEIPSCANQSVIGIIENEIIPYEFIYPMMIKQIQNIIQHQTGGAQQHINKNNVERTLFVLPENKILNKYQLNIANLYQTILINCFENKNLQQIRDSLLPKLMSGEIDTCHSREDSCHSRVGGNPETTT